MAHTSSKAMSSGAPNLVDTRELTRWRNRLLPAMLTFVCVLTLFFMAVSVWQTRDIQQRIAPITRSPSVGAQLGSVLGKRGMTASDLAAAELHARVSLEDRALELRYVHAIAVLASREWVRFMGFVTGMVLALVGAIFILGRLETTASTAAGEAGVWKASLATTSPGLVLAAFGTVLMLSTIVVRISVDIRDKALYLGLPMSRDSSNEDTSSPAFRQEAGDIYGRVKGAAPDTGTHARRPTSRDR